MVEVYQLNLSVFDLRTKIREQFAKNQHVTDLRVIDILLLKGRQEYQETMNIWKQEVRPPSFLFSFIDGVLIDGLDWVLVQPHILAWFKEQEVRPFFLLLLLLSPLPSFFLTRLLGYRNPIGS